MTYGGTRDFSLLQVSMAVRLSQATSKVGRGLVAPALSSTAGKAVGGRFGKRSIKGVKNLGFISPD